MDAHFNHTIKQMFTDKQQVADELIAEDSNLVANYALKSVSANVARSEIVQYAIRHKSLSVLRNLISKYFVDKSEKLHKMFLDDNTDLFKILEHRLLLRSFADELYGTVNLMKRIYLLLFRYCNKHAQALEAPTQWIVCEDEPELRELALYYFKEIDSKREKINLETNQLELTFKRYEAQALKSRSSDQVEHTITAIDNIIDEAMDCADCIETNEPHMELDELYSMFRDNSNDLELLIDQSVDRKLLDDVRAAEQSAQAKLGEFSAEELASVSLSDIANLRASLRASRMQTSQSDNDSDADTNNDLKSEDGYESD